MHQSAEILKLVTKSTAITLYMVDESLNEIYLVPKAIYSDRHKVNWKIQPGSTIAAYVAYKKEYVLLEDIFNDDRFPNGLGLNNDMAKSVLAVPVLTPEGDCFGVLEMYRDVFSTAYEIKDLSIAIVVCGWMGAAIHQNRERVALHKQKRINDCLLDLIKCFFTSDLPLAKMIGEIMKLAKASIQAQKGSFYVIDSTSPDLVADVFEEGIEDDGMYKKNVKVKLMKDRSIAGLVARQRITVKLNDMYKNKSNKEIDDRTGFITRCIMSTPIISGQDVIGVVQVVNKSDPYEHFTRTDENLFKVISVYCALALHFDKLRVSVTKHEHFNMCYVDMLVRHMRPCIHDTKFLEEHMDIDFPPDFNRFFWYIPENLLQYMPQYCIFMFREIIGEEFLDMQVLMRFVLTVRKMYRNNPYHNFEHGFTVTHCMYNMLIRNKGIFSQIENSALMIAALCHDIDHRGLTNNFLKLTGDNLALLYEESIMENHHIQVTMMILNDCPILIDLSENDRQVLLREIKDNILATDLVQFFKVKSKLSNLLHEFDFSDEEHRQLLRTVMMTGADLSGNAKPFLVAKVVMQNLYKEFYHQGDMEKELGLRPLSTMDRDRESQIPDDQVYFQSVLVLPCYYILKVLLPSTMPLYVDAYKLKDCWAEIIEMKGSKHWRQFESVVSKRISD
ncbi:cAMP and cAMP-inhibited cGMP 3',5'-cyclic phosphodiesterase 10A isoform X2 [Aethina tumida]|nr:cAMP and cAMP-inhibited cGMP 3',5'-cyclic phosphodiesterase 10A isoform X2 [Aethina tumida]